jgi:hypothetical protein
MKARMGLPCSKRAKFGTCSKTPSKGWCCRRYDSCSNIKLPRVSSPAFLPATENDWHRAPASYTSHPSVAAKEGLLEQGARNSSMGAPLRDTAWEKQSPMLSKPDGSAVGGKVGELVGGVVAVESSVGVAVGAAVAVVASATSPTRRTSLGLSKARAEGSGGASSKRHWGLAAGKASGRLTECLLQHGYWWYRCCVVHLRQSFELFVFSPEQILIDDLSERANQRVSRRWCPRQQVAGWSFFLHGHAWSVDDGAIGLLGGRLN